MNFCNRIPVCFKCISFFFGLVLIFLAMVSVDSVKNSHQNLRENFKKKFQEQDCPCMEKEMEVKIHFFSTVAGTSFCDGFNFDRVECYSNSSLGLSELQYYSIELIFTESASVNVSGRNQNIKIALCAPTKCKEKDLRECILKSLRQSVDEYLEVKTDSAICCAIDEKASRSIYLYVSFCFLTFIIFIITCTVYDLAKNLYKKDNDRPRSKLSRLSKDFSIISNFHRLTDTSIPNEKPCIHLTNIFYLVFIIIGQRQIFFNIYSGSQKSQAYEISSSRCVDVLFMISGFLTFYYGFKPMKKGSGLFLVISIVFRWLRMVPIYCVLALFVVHILPNLGDGVLWRRNTSDCASFWLNLFCVGDFLDSCKECLSISWYIKLDLQFSVIGGLLSLIFTKSTKAGSITLSLILVCANIFTTGYNAWFVADTIRFHTSMFSRISPYLIGMLTYVQKGCILTVVYILKMTVILYDWSIPMRENSLWSSLFVVAYDSLSRWFYVSLEASTILIYYTNGLGLLNEIIEWRIIIPIGRLSYVVLLASSVIQLFHTLNQRGTCNIYMTHSTPNLIFWTSIDVLCAYTTGLLIHLFFEAPFSRISKKLLKYLLGVFAKPEENPFSKNNKADLNKESEKSPMDEKQINGQNSSDKINLDTSQLEKAVENDKVIMKKM